MKRSKIPNPGNSRFFKIIVKDREDGEMVGHVVQIAGDAIAFAGGNQRLWQKQNFEYKMKQVTAEASEKFFPTKPNEKK